MNHRTQILPGVYLTAVQSDKFKTGCFSLNLLRPMKKEEAAANALIPSVLLRGSVQHPDIASISAKLDELYGASIGTLIRKKGEVQLVGFYCDYVQDEYVQEPVFAPLMEFLSELLFSPRLENGAFPAGVVESEKQNLLNAMLARINDKRSYANSQLLRTMCAGQPYGVPRIGEPEDLDEITPQSLYAHYRQILGTSRVEMFYCGSAKQERVQGALCRAFAALPRGVVTEGEPIRRIAAPEQPRYLTEEMDVTQGKLSMGWRCGTDDVPAMIMANLIFGGTSNAKLFLNVREKMSLCYYASSSYARSKGIMTVSSGIETKDFQKAHDEILHQLELVKQGQWEDWELQGALATMCSSLTSLSDSQGALENYCLGQTAIGAEDTPEDLMAALHQVTPERIRKAAQSCQLDTVFFLKGKEAATC